MKSTVFCIALAALLASSCGVPVLESESVLPHESSRNLEALRVVRSDAGISLFSESDNRQAFSKEALDLLGVLSASHPDRSIDVLEIEVPIEATRAIEPTHIWSIEFEQDLGFHWHTVPVLFDSAGNVLATEVYQCHRYKIYYFCPKHSHSKTAFSHTFE